MQPPIHPLRHLIFNISALPIAIGQSIMSQSIICPYREARCPNYTNILALLFSSTPTSMNQFMSMDNTKDMKARPNSLSSKARLWKFGSNQLKAKNPSNENNSKIFRLSLNNTPRR